MGQKSSSAVSAEVSSIETKTLQNSKSVPSPVGDQTFELRSYIPKEKNVVLLESAKGTFQIPHRIFEFLFKAPETKSELIVLACLLRYTLGFHRSSCEASITFIIEWTGLCKSMVRSGLAGLLSKELIKLSAAGTKNQDSAIYEVPFVKAYLDSLKTSKELEHVSDNPKTENPTTIATGQTEQKSAKEGANQAQNCARMEHTSEQIRHSTVLDLGTKKENTNTTLNKKHTLQSLSEKLAKYFDELKPKAKRERELKNFESLSESYDLGDIEDSVTYLLDRGLPGSGEKCHSPMGFLACCMDSVLQIVQKEREQIEKKHTAKTYLEDRKRFEAELAVEEERQFQKNKEAFFRAFPSSESQNEYLKQIAKKYPFYREGSDGLLSAGISMWASSQNNKNN